MAGMAAEALEYETVEGQNADLVTLQVSRSSFVSQWTVANNLVLSVCTASCEIETVEDQNECLVIMQYRRDFLFFLPYTRHRYQALPSREFGCESVNAVRMRWQGAFSALFLCNLYPLSCALCSG